MVEVQSVLRKWGKSSLAFVIPKEMVEQEKLKPDQKLRVILVNENNNVAKTFGRLKNWKKPTEKIIQEIDNELWPED